MGALSLSLDSSLQAKSFEEKEALQGGDSFGDDEDSSLSYLVEPRQEW